MALTRIASGESYVAGGAALNECLGAPRLSRDVDLFHDTEAALAATWEADRATLAQAGFAVRVVRERPSFVEALVARGSDQVLLQWVQDSAYRFFPLLTSEVFGLVLHPVDLATNKLLALIGRSEVRDWVDTVEASVRCQPLAYLAWAACGKDLGFSPAAIVELAAASARHAPAEVALLEYEGPAPDFAAVAAAWRASVAEARQILGMLPSREVGRCVLHQDGTLYRGRAEDLAGDLAAGRLRVHEGRVRGAFPFIKGGG
jgi:hypothetical protein